MRHLDFLLSCLDLGGVAAVDIGCGDGGFAREMAGAGATVVGIELDAGRVGRANARSGDNPRFMVGRAERLPLDPDSRDLACLLFSFHHIPAGLHGDALAEVSRVLRPGGRLHVVEPLPEDPEADIMRELDDETEVRTGSHDRLSGLGPEHGYRLLGKRDYASVSRYADVGEFLDSIVLADPGRAARLPAVREALTEKFHRVARKDPGGHALSVPCRAYHFEVAG